jgi:hypothetical protein
MKKIQQQALIISLMQGVYLLVAALWPLLDLESFLRITGIETDSWLLRITGVFMVAVSITLIASYYFQEHSWIVSTLAMICAAGTFYIDTFYYMNSELSLRLYTVDVIVQLFFVMTWSVLLGRFWFLKNRSKITVSEQENIKVGD